MELIKQYDSTRLFKVSDVSVGDEVLVKVYCYNRDGSTIERKDTFRVSKVCACDNGVCHSICHTGGIHIMGFSTSGSHPSWFETLLCAVPLYDKNNRAYKNVDKE